MTAVAGYISVVDLTKASDIILARTYDAFFPLFFTAFVYFLICWLLVNMLRFLGTKIDPSARSVSREILGVVNAFDPEHAEEYNIQNNYRTDKDNSPLIRVEHLRKSFENVTPVKDVSFDISRGDIISIIGPSGTGKSTLLYLLNHLLEPDDGKILFEGKDTLAKGYDFNRMREQIGMVFQSFNLFPHLTIIENLMLAQTELLKRSRREACEEKDRCQKGSRSRRGCREACEEDCCQKGGRSRRGCREACEEDDCQKGGRSRRGRREACEEDRCQKGGRSP